MLLSISVKREDKGANKERAGGEAISRNYRHTEARFVRHKTATQK